MGPSAHPRALLGLALRRLPGIYRRGIARGRGDRMARLRSGRRSRSDTMHRRREEGEIADRILAEIRTMIRQIRPPNSWTGSSARSRARPSLNFTASSRKRPSSAADSKPPDPNAAQVRSSGWRLRTGEAESREPLRRPRAPADAAPTTRPAALSEKLAPPASFGAPNRGRGPKQGHRDYDAATASRHSLAASARNAHSADREMSCR
jgi:hypothetical protein